MIDNVFYSLYLLMCVCYVGDVVCTVQYLIRKRPDTRQMDRIIRAFMEFWIIAFLLLLLAYLWAKSLVHFIANL
nr:MAG TPA: hypothetical protein [Caudoviricetes sp.]